MANAAPVLLMIRWRKEAAVSANIAVHTPKQIAALYVMFSRAYMSSRHGAEPPTSTACFEYFSARRPPRHLDTYTHRDTHREQVLGKPQVATPRGRAAARVAQAPPSSQRPRSTISQELGKTMGSILLICPAGNGVISLLLSKFDELAFLRHFHFGSLSVCFQGISLIALM